MSLSSVSQGRFLPGAMIAQRYRIVALLGRGGMGEVYRADDLKLGEAVALKFLPERVERDASLRERLVGEARLARQVAHPNVCRVYDIGEVESRLFLSMEYIDGEDLGTLLRRIGRLPQDKSVQLAREICLGLHAAHEQGIVHRDLKPSNVMIDGRGRARLTDFGLAAIAEGMNAEDASAGTPAYMAPEQLIGIEASVRTDMYALGLVLYELFTGKPAFAASGWAELTYLKQNTTPSNPSQLTPDLDPLIERAIMRCLQIDADLRPESAAQVAAALPGGDPLAAALAAGELPTTEMVAEAGDAHVVPRGQAVAWLAAVVALVLAVFVAAQNTFLVQQLPVGKSPPVLMDRARNIAVSLGYADAPGDEYGVMIYDGLFVKGLGQKVGAAALLDHLRRQPGGALRFMYRSSPMPLVTRDPSSGINSADPPLTVTGMVVMSVDGQGRLFGFEAAPPERDTTTVHANADWSKLFAAAGLDTAAFTRVTPQWTPRTFADERAAWVGRAPGDSAIAIRIEAAAHNGRPTLFRRIYPWTTPSREVSSRPNALTVVYVTVLWSVLVGLLVLAVVTARNNLRSGDADREGTLRMGLTGAGVMVLAYMLSMHWVPDANVIARRLFYAVEVASLLFLIIAALYLTLEPIVRRTWPETLVSWVRLLDGRFRDPRVGRDTMAGIVLGTLTSLLGIVIAVAYSKFTHAPLAYGTFDTPAVQTDAMMGWPDTLYIAIQRLLTGVQLALMSVAILAGATTLFKRRMVALAATALVMAFIQFPGDRFNLAGLLMLALVIFTCGFALLRFGFLTLLLTFALSDFFTEIPLAAPGSSWYWNSTAFGLALVFALAIWAFRGMLASEAPIVTAPPSAPSGGARRVTTPTSAGTSSARLAAAQTPSNAPTLPGR